MADLDRYDLKLLRICPDRVYEFMRTPNQEGRAFQLFQRGLLERRSELYRLSAGGKNCEMRWAYRRTDAGRLAAKMPDLKRRSRR